MAALALTAQAACAHESPRVDAPLPAATATSPATTSARVPAVSAGTTPAFALAMPGGKMVGLNEAAVPFATYLNAVHNRIHPQFADVDIAEMDALPPNDPTHDKKLVTRVELVLDGATGAIVKKVIAKPSGVAEFDRRALGSLEKTAPYGEAPHAIRSADGNVYLSWELRRDEIFACSTMHARPYLFVLATEPAQTVSPL